MITLVLMTALISFALTALLVRDGKWAISAWMLMALTLVLVWLLLGLLAVALAQAVLAAGLTGWLFWRSYRTSMVGR